MRDSLGSFPDELPVFLIPNLVIFPGIRIPLQILESRYSDLAQEIYESDSMFVLVQSKSTDSSRPLDRYPMGCAAKILRLDRFGESRYSIVVVGIVRVRLGEKVESQAPYPVYKVTPVIDRIDEMMQVRSRKIVVRCMQLLNKLLRKLQDVPVDIVLRPVMLPLGVIIDSMVHHLPIQGMFRQVFLEESDVLRRAQTLELTLEKLLEKDFSKKKFKVNHLPVPSRN